MAALLPEVFRADIKSVRIVGESFACLLYHKEQRDTRKMAGCAVISCVVYYEEDKKCRYREVFSAAARNCILREVGLGVILHGKNAAEKGGHGSVHRVQVC